MTVGASNGVRVRRPEIQALRALAIGAVVLYHFWPRLAPGGQVGVDVFFVVSGFLITGMLVREAEGSGRLALKAFYVRRARRLLPAAGVVLFTSTLVALLVVPRVHWPQLAREALGSALYAQNFVLIASDRTPGARTLDNSPLRHFWSLSVEEQIYVVWPLLIIAGLALSNRLGVPVRTTVAVALVSIAVASFLWNLRATELDGTVAYFSTAGRAWEFAVGGLLVFVADSGGRVAEHWRAAASWLGLALIAVALVVATDGVAFPGWVVLLPVVGTAMITWAGTSVHRWSPHRIAGAPPVQWLGDISYSLYLWHWPIVVLTPFITGVPSESWLMLLLLALALLLAWATTRWVEKPFRAAAIRTS